MAVATLSIDLVAQLAQLQQGLDKAGRLAEKNAAQIEARYAKMAATASAVGAALGGAISVAGITAFVRATVDGIDKLNDLSDATGASIENLSALEDIGARTGTSIETVGDAVLKLNKVLADAKPGSDQAAILQALGLSAEQLKREDPAEAVRQVAVALAGFADEGKKARYVQELFGKSTKDVAAFLKDVAGAGKLNATVTTEQAKAAEAFNQELFALQKNITDVSRSLAGPLLSALNDTIEKFRQGSREGKSFFETLGDEQKKLLGIDVDASAAKALRTELAGIDALLANGVMMDQRRVALQEKRAVLAERLNKLEAKAMTQNPAFRPSQNYGDAFKPSLPDLPPAKVKGAGQAPKPFVSNSFDQGLISALKELDKTDAAKLRDLNEQLSALFDLQRETRGDPVVVQAIANVKAEIAGIGPEAKKAADEKKRLDAILAATPQGILQDVLTDIELINRAFDNGSQDTEKWAAAIRVAVGKLPQETEKALEEISEFSREAARNIQSGFADTILATFDGNSQSILKIWGNMLKRMAAEALAADLSAALLGKGYGSTTNNVGGFIGMLGGLFGGGGFQAAFSQTALGSSGFGTGMAYGNMDFGGFFAEGGYLGAGKWGIAGERGPEVIKGPAQVVPSGGMQSSSQVVQINVAGDVSERNVKLIQRAIANERARSMRAY